MKFEVKSKGEVLSVKEVMTSNQTVKVKTYFDQEFHTKLTTDKETITADGSAGTTITATVYNYLDEPQAEWSGDIIFELDGEQQTILTTNGQAEITFSTSVPREYTIKTNIPNFRNGEIRVVAE
ncbi:hypothetical protein [Virgibacillus sediminis]|uniref:BppU N-terminal domain-containing protein n=1 Tax=Virgibacillus sediminis TaxID=202260 RepID=A0ABV7A6G7_9BACI